MRSLLALLVAAAALALAGAASAAPGTLLVTFDDRPSRAEASARIGTHGAVRPVLPEAGIWAIGVRSRDGQIAAVSAHPRVVIAEWSARRTTDAIRRPARPLPRVLPPDPDDRLFDPENQPGLFAGTWGPTSVAIARRPRIAILDSGIDVDHEEWGGPSSPLVAGRSTWTRSKDSDDWGINGHGTHVAGVAAAPANGVGIVGVAPARRSGAQVIPVQISDTFGVSQDEQIIRGVRWAVRRGAKVVNISSGGPEFNRTFQEVVWWAEEKGALIVASVGNDGDGANTFNYPAGYQRVLGVGAVCNGVSSFDCPDADGPAIFSNRNASVDLMAVGVGVVSSVPDRVRRDRVAPGYATNDGTSFSAPFVAGAAALVFANHVNPSPFQVRRALLNAASDIGPRGRDSVSGYGVVNPEAAARGRLPLPDPFEVNDTPARAHTLKGRFAPNRLPVDAAVDQFDDRDDVYRVWFRRGDLIRLRLNHERGRVNLNLWQPGTKKVRPVRRARGVTRGTRRSRRVTLDRRASRTGWHYVHVAAQKGFSRYSLRVRRN